MIHLRDHRSSAQASKTLLSIQLKNREVSEEEKDEIRKDVSAAITELYETQGETPLIRPDVDDAIATAPLTELSDQLSNARLERVVVAAAARVAAEVEDQAGGQGAAGYGESHGDAVVAVTPAGRP